MVDLMETELSMTEQFAIHASAIAIKEFDREELEEAFVEMLYNKAVERQTFIAIMKEHGIDADIKLSFLNANQVPQINMATRTFSGTLDTLEHEGSEITYKGSTDACDRSENIRGFQINPGSTGDIIVKLDRSIGIKSVEIFQEDEYAASSAPTGYTGFSDIEQSGKGKGAVAMTVTNAAKNYLVILKTDGYSEVTFGGTVDVP